MLATTTRLTAAEFLTLPESNLPTELLEGEIIMALAPTVNHQRLVARFYDLVKKLAAGGEVLFSPIDVWLDDENVVQPDVMWVAPGSSCVVVENRYWQGAPDLVVEVFSAGTARTDKGKKFKLYEKYGTREYWMADPGEQYLEVWRREEERFQLVGVFGPEETFISALLGGQTISVGEVFKAQ
jgi:Uma2 family endonuclease